MPFNPETSPSLGFVEIGDLLRKVHTLHIYHPYVSRLELTRDEKKLPRERRGEAREAKCGWGFTMKIVAMESTISYPPAHYFKSACALSFVSGRGLPGLVGTAVHMYV